MKLDAGSIVLVPFPYTDLSASKRRPVLLLTDTNSRGDFIAMALTSRSQTEHAVAIAGGPLPLGGALVTNSWVRTDKIITLRQTVVSKVMGRVNASTRQQCVQQLCHALNAVN